MGIFGKKKDDLAERLTKEEREKFKQMGAENYVEHLRSDKTTYGDIPEDELTSAVKTYEETSVKRPLKGFRETFTAGLASSLGEGAIYSLGAVSRLIIERYKK